MISPITGSKKNIHIYAEFKSKDIINLYKKNLGIDVKRFFEGEEKITLYECQQSKLKFFSPTNLEGDEKLYKDLQALKGDNYYSKWKWENQIALNFINKNDKVLDVGCGNGVFLEKLKKMRINAKGIEFNKQAVNVCLEKELDVECIDIHDFVDKDNKFDVICAFQVLEHISSVKEFIDGMLKGLKKGGKLVLGTPNNNPFLYKYDIFHTLNLPPHHMGLWNKESYKSLEEYFSMKLVSIKIEPLYAFHYWLKIQLKHKFPKHSTFIEQVIDSKIITYGIVFIGNFFQKKIQGRNIVAIYEKIEKE